MSSFQPADPGDPGEARVGVAGYPVPNSGQRSLGLSDLVLAGGGLLFVLGSFLTWIFIESSAAPGLEFGDPCADIADPGFRGRCEEAFGVASTPAPTGFSANAWDLSLTSAAAVIMALVALAAAALALRVLRSKQTLRRGLTAAVLVVDVIVVNFVGLVDFSSLGQRFLDESLGDLAGVGTPGLALGVGFWIALGGLLAANVGALVAQRASGQMRQPAG